MKRAGPFCIQPIFLLSLMSKFNEVFAKQKEITS